MAMTYEPATDNGSCSANPTPAVDIGNFTFSEVSINGIKNCHHEFLGWNAYIKYWIPVNDAMVG
tara:strand:+ start:509 stop:700 length:192 start_codon:yes stop_codon:yes gene_type:complete